jgi:DnaJ-class molecular chaperone
MGGGRRKEIMIRIEQIIAKIDKICECPDCHGEGGYTEVITDDGRGPRYTCGFCNGKGTMNIFRKLYFLILLNKERKQRDKYLPKTKLIASATTRKEIIKRIAEYFHNDYKSYYLDGNSIYYKFNRNGWKELIIGFWVLRKRGRYWFESFIDNSKEKRR